MTRSQLAAIIHKAIEDALTQKSGRIGYQPPNPEEKGGAHPCMESRASLFPITKKGRQLKRRKDSRWGKGLACVVLLVALEEHEKSQSILCRARWRPTPFTEEVLLEELPFNFHSPHLGDYDGSTDPEKHLYKFENVTLLHQYSDVIKC